MKCCATCHITKPPVGFYRTAKGGLMHICKECHKERMRQNRLLNPDVQERDRKRAKRTDRRAAARQTTIRRRKENPAAYKAQTAVGNAIRDGKLKRAPCALCGSTSNVHGHHKDYARPLEVTWLCAKCHHRLHITFPELGGHFTEAAE